MHHLHLCTGTVSDEVDAGSMEVKREFLARFMARKQIKLSKILASRRTRSFAKKETTGSSKFVKFRDKSSNCSNAVMEMK